MYALTQGLKHTVDKTRPDGSDNHSFRSGHVATAFLSAEQLRMNYGTWWGVAGYTFATGTAFLRLYNNRHWLGDVIGAAGIGILSARIGYWLLPLEKRLLKLDSNENNSSLVAVPTVDTYNKTYGLAMAIQF
jgi:membrane-associated phospholipid phosphatase